jgi:hypothetical protein
MNQTLLDLDTAHAHLIPTHRIRDGMTQTVDAADRVGFLVGWDHARLGLAPAAELLIEDSALGQGWRASRAVQGGRPPVATWVTRHWLGLRLRAWQEGVDFDTRSVTPASLAALRRPRCPITRAALAGLGDAPDAAVVERVDPGRGYAAGNLTVISAAAADAWAGRCPLECLRQAHRLQVGGPAPAGLDAAAWTRMAALRAFGAALPFHEAARLPLTVLPPTGVDVVNAVQRLQWALTLQFASPGWSRRTREIAQTLPAHTTRQDFHLFIGALAPRVLEAQAQAESTGPWTALEDAWLHERVLRRWQHFVLSLGEAGVVAMLERIELTARAPSRAMKQARAQRPEDARRARAAGSGRSARRPQRAGPLGGFPIGSPSTNGLPLTV